MNILEKSLFETNSIKIASADSPFWYTSGTIGPYFINTHFLFGGEKEANELLKFIDENKDDHKRFIAGLYSKVIDFYNINEKFRKVMDFFYSGIKNDSLFKKCEYISGGERRDWFFSPVISLLSNKKLLYIFKDLTVYDQNEKISDLNNSRVCHICDLVTQASSHKRAWIPAINNINGKIILNASIVDRDEGADKLFKAEKVKNISMVKINKSFLDILVGNNIIGKEQSQQILRFKKDPDGFGKNFILNNPVFLKKSLNEPGSKSKAERCIADNPYNLDFKQLNIDSQL